MIDMQFLHGLFFVQRGWNSGQILSVDISRASLVQMRLRHLGVDLMVYVVLLLADVRVSCYLLKKERGSL
jgi:hypothetical protein